MEKPLIVQGDQTILLDVHCPGSEEARADLSAFAELEKSPEHMHTYRITPISLWNAASFGLTAEQITTILEQWSRFPLPDNVVYSVRETVSRFGKLTLLPTDDPNRFLLNVEEEHIRKEVLTRNRIAKLLIPTEDGFLIDIVDRGTIKQELIKIGYPVKDLAPLRDGERFPFSLKETVRSGAPFELREYQREAADIFVGNLQIGTGFGTILLPCGSGKTVVGMAVMEQLETSTLILTTNIAAVHQWIEELTDKTTIPEESIGEYTGEKKEIRPITITTYQILTWRPDKNGTFPHFHIFRERNWGLIIYDEVHLLPAPVFRVTAELQAVRRLGLTATLVREDNREDEVFSLVGPKRYDVPWKELEAKGWIAEATCYEIRVDLPQSLKITYASSDKRKKYRIASENPHKLTITEMLIANHPEDSILVIGQYLDQLGSVADRINAPLITGKTPNREREQLYNRFRKGEITVLIVSKVANFAIDLPDASVAIQISGAFGSRQEEAQRLGRILRPKKKNSYFYSIITRYTVEESFAANRQKFLTEQGYSYHIEQWEEKELVNA
jgi:DNA excision repair protein ERCC-3